MGKNSMNIKKGDTVKVIAGKDKGAQGKVITVLREEQRVIVEGVNRVKRHTKAVQQAATPAASSPPRRRSTSVQRDAGRG